MIRAENVVKVFSGRGVIVRAVDGVSTSVDKAEVVVIIGPSGSGKSTLSGASTVWKASMQDISS